MTPVPNCFNMVNTTSNFLGKIGLRNMGVATPRQCQPKPCVVPGELLTDETSRQHYEQ